MKVSILNSKKMCETRIRLGYGLREFSRLSGISHTVLSRLETGKQNSIRPSTAKRLSNALNIAYDELFTIID